MPTSCPKESIVSVVTVPDRRIEAVRRGAPVELVRSAIINPARLSHDRQIDVCLQCHLETTSLKLPAVLLRYGRSPFSYLPGEPLADFALYFDDEGRHGGSRKMAALNSPAPRTGCASQTAIRRAEEGSPALPVTTRMNRRTLRLRSNDSARPA